MSKSTTRHTQASLEIDYGPTPLPGQRWCPNGDINSGLGNATFCAECGAEIPGDE